MRRTGYENQENRIGRTRGNGAENFSGNDLKTVKKTVKKTVRKTVKKTVEKTVKKNIQNSPEIRHKNKPKIRWFLSVPKFGFSQFYHNIKGVSRKLPKTLCEIIVLILWTFCENINFAK